MTRTRAFAAVALPVAMLLALHDASVRAASGGADAQAMDQTPLLSRSGVDLSALDQSVDPCTDFYQFACGGWMAKHPAPPDKPRYGRFEELQDRNDAILRDILDQASKPNAPANMRQIGDYYSSCIDESDIDAKGIAALNPELRRVEAITTKAEIPAVLGHMQTVGETAFFGFGSAPDFKDASHYILIFAQGGLGLPDRDYYLRTDANSVKLRDEYVQHVGRMLQLGGEPQARAEASAKAIMQIETTLAQHALDRVSQRNPANIYHKMPRDEVRKLMPSFNLSAFLETAEAAPGDSANVSEPDFLKTVDQVVASTPLDDLKTYMRWHIIHTNATVLPTPFDQENFAFYGKTLTGAKAEQPRWKRCVRATDSDLGEALGKAYVDRAFGPEGKQRTVQLVRDIETEMGQDLKQLTWMSDATKQQAEVKLREVANKIGYPDKWRDYASLKIVRGDALGNSLRANTFEYRREMAKIGQPVDKTEWAMTPPTVNAYYNPFENNINFPAGILQPPFYNKAADDAVNFGAAAAVVGHELTHGFDDEGRQFDAQGNLRDWWAPVDAKAFEERVSCIANQYSGYTPVDDVHLNGRLTLGENTADNGGLRLAWMALMDDLKTKHLAEADGFSPEQRFFIGWGQMWCENATPEMERLQAQTNPHSPGRFRANGVVSNMPEFAQAFSCKTDAKMVNHPVCRVW
ncbi:MAG TPA: M13 family metallopeptidase [Vicinamibacterales bacterium]